MVKSESQTELTKVLLPVLLCCEPDKSLAGHHDEENEKLDETAVFILPE